MTEYKVWFSQLDNAFKPLVEFKMPYDSIPKVGEVVRFTRLPAKSGHVKGYWYVREVCGINQENIADFVVIIEPTVLKDLP